jgi:hypothetical protein
MSSYTHAPPLHRNPLLASMQLLLWWLLHPSAWRNFVQSCDPHLSPSFALLQLGESQWRNPQLRHALLSGLAAPLLTGVLIQFALALTGHSLLSSLIGVGFALVITLVFASILGFAMGIGAGTVATLAFGLLWNAPKLLMLDVLFGVQFGVGFGLLSLMALIIESNLSLRRAALAAPRQLGSLVVGLLVGGFIVTSLITITTTLFTQGQAGGGGGSATWTLTAGIPSLLLAFTAFIHTQKLDRAAFLGSIYFALAVWMIGNVGQEYGKDPTALQLLTSTNIGLIGSFLIIFCFPFALVSRIAGRWAGAIAGVLALTGAHIAAWRVFGLYAVTPNVLIYLACVALGLIAKLWLPLVLLPLESAFSTVLLQGDIERNAKPSQHSLLHLHPVFWDELQRLRLGSLDEHILLIHERNPADAQAALNFISTTQQNATAQRVQIELDARRIEECQQIDDIVALTLAAPSGAASDLLNQFVTVRDDVRAALNQSSTYNCGLLLKAVQDQLASVVGALNRRDDLYARRFRVPAQSWERIIRTYLNQLDENAKLRGEVPSPYIVGTPLTRHQGIFVGRTDISARIEALLRNDDQPPLLLYGQRRMGKTSLLFNLRWLLPNRILPLVVDLQGPVTLASDHAAFLYNLAKGMSSSAAKQSLELPPLSRASLVPDPFTAFDDWLDAVEQTLTQTGKTTVLLALDEFEALDEALARGQLDGPAIMGTLRHIIQYRPRFKLILAGSHSVEEFQRWASYLINAQTIHISYLKESETLQLVEHPIKDFPLRYLGEASQRVLAITRGHPYLVQLLCSEIVALKNEQDTDVRYVANTDDIEQAAVLTLERGQQYFIDIARNQLNEVACAVARYVAARSAGRGLSLRTIETAFADTGAVNQAVAVLLRREIIEMKGELVVFQVNLIQRWFAKEK